MRFFSPQKTYRDLHNQRESIRQGEMKEDDALSELTRNGKRVDSAIEDTTAPWPYLAPARASKGETLAEV